ncbi:MAG: alpha/beta fold hydrolase [Pseudomonadales bacterium]|jgi:pimeloyl-ACP methyl ester carboxylesterase|nr:alpha/beta fold hydrolase [Pseudomonadales bacterium]
MRQLILLLLVAVLSACGGGGGGSSTATPEPAPEPTEPTGPEPTSLVLVDAVPASSSNTDPQLPDVSFAHLGHSDLAVTLDGDCNNFSGITLRRQLFDLSEENFDELLDHRVTCNLEDNATYQLTADGTRSNDAAFRAEHTVNTTSAVASNLVVQNTLDMPRSNVDDLFFGYMIGALIDELDLPGAVESLILATLFEIAGANWDNLVDPNALYDVRSERVSYLSTTPDGSPSSALTGLVTYPIINSSAFSARDKVIVLMHATGSTPSEQDPADAWFILANQFASRGYLVIAADNFGRGGTATEAETYLLANRTARNTHHLVSAVLQDSNYDNIYNGNAITIIGYSQGGHSAMAYYQHLASHQHNLEVREVYAGGAPHDLYQTFRGVLEFLDSSCNGNNYCRYVDDETTVPFATDRILPGITAYTDSGFELSELTDGETLNADLVTGFLANDPAYDGLKVILQLNSFTNLVSVSGFTGTSSLVHLYHSEYDRLVPHANTAALANALQDTVNLDFHENRCNSSGYETIFNLTEKVGVLHTLCGLSVLDDAMEDLK